MIYGRPRRGRGAAVEVGDRVAVRNRYATEGHSLTKKGQLGDYLEVAEVHKATQLTFGGDLSHNPRYPWLLTFVFTNGTKIALKANSAVTFQKPRSE
jgi:hypothetical protein